MKIKSFLAKPYAAYVKKKIKKDLSFSKEGWKEIQDFHYKVCENLNLAIDALITGEKEMAKK